jgi:TRAP-type C4-dicarboxylate transport system permease small subunit
MANEPRTTALAFAPLAFIDRGIAWFESVLLAAGVLLMAVNTIGNVIGRFVFDQSLYFAEELNQFLIVLITFVGIGYAARQGRHIRMTAIYDALPDSGRKALMTVICLVTGLTMLALSWYAYSYVSTVAASGRVLPALQVPIWWAYVCVPVGFAVTGIQYLLGAVRNLTERDIYLSASTVDSYDDVDEPV